MPPIPGAREGINYLSDLGYEIRFVTHKPTQGGAFKHHAIRDCVQWLSWNNIEYDSIVFDGDKARYTADLIIDDNPNMNWTQPYKLNLLFDQPWNQNPNATLTDHALHSYMRVDNWQDVQMIVGAK